LVDQAADCGEGGGEVEVQLGDDAAFLGSEPVDGPRRGDVKKRTFPRMI